MTELDREQYWAGLQSTLGPGAVMVTDSGRPPWGQAMLTRNHVQFADAEEENGQDSGPSPHDLVLMALGACTAITLRMYAARKEWVIDRVSIRLRFENPEIDDRHIERLVELEGPLDADQRARLLAIAEKCPVHKLLSAGVTIRSELGGI